MSVNLLCMQIPVIVVGAFLALPSKHDELESALDFIANYSQRFKHGQRHYSVSMKSCRGVVFTLVHWRPYLCGKYFMVVTDHHALTHLHLDTSNMLTRWAFALQHFDFTHEHAEGN